MNTARRVTGTGPGVDSTKRKMSGPGNQSLNHLLNFSLPPRQSHQTAPIPRRSRRVGTQQGIWNKEKFVNAQYRFIMNPNGDYTVHFADPDIYFQWQDILQVIVPRSSALAVAGPSSDVTASAGAEGQTTCPICLSPPAAPRMTKCGHIFCFPCILHYLGTSETTKWAKCPICTDSVASHQLRSVRWYDAEEDQREPGVLKMRLMERPQITTLALPRSPTWPSDSLPPHQAPFHFMPDVFAFSKFMIATPDYMITELTRELDELATERRTLDRLGDELGITFVDAAEEKVRRQLAKAQALDTVPLRAAEQRARREAEEITERARRRAEYEAQRREGSSVVTEEVPAALLNTTTKGPRTRKNVNPPPPSTSTYYFYQAASGLPIFLHPLDIRTLLAHFNSYASFPDVISVRVEAAQEGSVDDALRKRCKYLGHIPEATDVVFVEADLKDVVGEDALQPFEGALRMRRTKRKEKERKDDKARAKAEAHERERAQLPAVRVARTIEVWEQPPVEAFLSAVVQEEQSAADDPPQPVLTGAWGSRSFAAAAVEARPRDHEREDAHDDHEQFDEAWADLEGRTGGGGGRRGKKNRLVIIGGGGGGARRRR
ncbi:hypothetical protein EXIGLDRAFT_646696 [Exidia glandulosa HHB12029]|uniref:RING-type domain-containing protein n=1 Tax=Exidia glandulosa HHB12029 TaxID=1314781 RepID=A0A165I5K8_EXIGL|nr:hypothetical protein EXIGLDRAFT_646696 [Exidia glandulosa HHB12029]